MTSWGASVIGPPDPGGHFESRGTNGLQEKEEEGEERRRNQDDDKQSWMCYNN